MSQLGFSSHSGLACGTDAEADERENRRLDRIVQLEKILLAYQNLYDLPPDVQNVAWSSLFSSSGLDLWNFENGLLPTIGMLDKIYAESMKPAQDPIMQSLPPLNPSYVNVARPDFTTSFGHYGDEAGNMTYNDDRSFVIGGGRSSVHDYRNDRSFGTNGNYSEIYHCTEDRSFDGNKRIMDESQMSNGYNQSISTTRPVSVQLAYVPSQQPRKAPCQKQPIPLMNIPLGPYPPKKPNSFYSKYMDPRMSFPPQAAQGNMNQPLPTNFVEPMPSQNNSRSNMAPFNSTVIGPMRCYPVMHSVHGPVIPIPVVGQIPTAWTAGQNVRRTTNMVPPPMPYFLPASHQAVPVPPMFVPSMNTPNKNELSWMNQAFVAEPQTPRMVKAPALMSDSQMSTSFCTSDNKVHLVGQSHIPGHPKGFRVPTNLVLVRQESPYPMFGSPSSPAVFQFPPVGESFSIQHFVPAPHPGFGESFRNGQSSMNTSNTLNSAFYNRKEDTKKGSVEQVEEAEENSTEEMSTLGQCESKKFSETSEQSRDECEFKHVELVDDVFVDEQEEVNEQLTPNPVEESTPQELQEHANNKASRLVAEYPSQDLSNTDEKAFPETSKIDCMPAMRPDSSEETKSGKTSPADSAYSDEFLAGGSSSAITPEPQFQPTEKECVSPLTSTSEGISYAGAVAQSLSESRTTPQEKTLAQADTSSDETLVVQTPNSSVQVDNAELDTTLVETTVLSEKDLSTDLAEQLAADVSQIAAPHAEASRAETPKEGSSEGPSTSNDDVPAEALVTKQPVVPKAKATRKKHISKKEKRIRREEAEKLKSDDDTLDQAIAENRRLLAAAEEQRRILAKPVLALFTPENVKLFTESPPLCVENITPTPSIPDDFKKIILRSIAERSERISKHGYLTDNSNERTKEYYETVMIFKSLWKFQQSSIAQSKGFMATRIEALSQMAQPQAKTRLVIYKYLHKYLPDTLLPEIMMLAFLLFSGSYQFATHEKLFFVQF